MSQPHIPPYCMALFVDFVKVAFVKVVFRDRFENKILICRFTGLQLLRMRMDSSSHIGNSEKQLNFISNPSKSSEDDIGTVVSSVTVPAGAETEVDSGNADMVSEGR